MRMNKTFSLFLSFLILLGMLPLVRAAETGWTPEQIAGIQEALRDESKELPISEEFRVHVETSDLSDVRGLDPDWMNILLLGSTRETSPSIMDARTP